jgi:hypothetical protein
MSGQLEGSARHYEQPARNERLSRRDRARARLRVGTALSRWALATTPPRSWRPPSVSSRHLVRRRTGPWRTSSWPRAHRGAGHLDQALHYIGIARTTGTVDSPMQRVRLDTAYRHMLLSDAATRRTGGRAAGAVVGAAGPRRAHPGILRRVAPSAAVLPRTGRCGRSVVYEAEWHPVLAGQRPCQVPHVDAAGAQVARVPRIDQDGGAARADGGVQQAAQVGFGGRADLLPDLDRQTPGVAADHDGRGTRADVSGSHRP